MRGRWLVARWFGVFVLGLLGVFALVPSAPVRAASNVVNTLTDASNGSCATTCTLRDAIALANDGDTITFSVSGTIPLNQALGTLTVNNAITIQGPTTSTGITVDGGCTNCQVGGAHTTGVQIFVMTHTSGTATIDRLTLTHGNNDGGTGGAIRNGSSGALVVTNCFITENHAGGSGAINSGDSGGALTVTNSTIANNSESSAGGDILQRNGTLTMTNDTVANNVFGISVVTGTAILTNVIAANNGGLDLFSPGGGGTFTGNNNLIDDTTFSNLSGTGNVHAPALLGTLGAYGTTNGTQTLPLLPGSPAINAGTASGAPAADQRGIARVGAVDIGAFESRGFTFSAPTGTPQSATINTPFATPLGITVTATAPVEPVNGGQIIFTVTPAGGASASLATSPATIAGGTASVTATANGTAGGPYTVTPTANGVTGTATFALTNTAASTTTTAQNATATFSAAAQAVTLNATVTSPAGTVNAGTVTFTVFNGATPIGSAATSSTVTAGSASVSYTLPANTPAAIDTIQAVYNAGGSFTTSTDSVHTLTIAAATLTFAPQTLPNGAVGIAYSQMLTASGGSGTGYTFAVTGGNLPAGLHLSSGGVLTGTPTATGPSTFTVTATDSASNTGAQAYTLTIVPAPLVSIAVTPAVGTLKVGQVQPYVATGTYADSTTADLTSQVTWSGDTATIAAVDTSGNVTGMSPGTAHITATLGAISGQTSVTVTQPTPVGIQPGAAPAGRPGSASAPGSAPTAAPTPKPLPTGR